MHALLTAAGLDDDEDDDDDVDDADDYDADDYKIDGAEDGASHICQYK